MSARVTGVVEGEARGDERRRFVRRSGDGDVDVDVDVEPSVRQLESAVAELRERIDGAREIRAELVSAREIVSALRDELRAIQAELTAERVASRRARMQIAWLEAELGRREATEEHLRSALAALTEALAQPRDDGDVARDAVARVTEQTLAHERSARQRVERELAVAQAELQTLRERGRPAGPAFDPLSVSELREALAELSGQRPDDGPADDRHLAAVGENFEAAAARLRARRDDALPGGHTILAPRGVRESDAPWLRDGLLAIAAENPKHAERLLVALLGAQAGCAPQPITYGLEIGDGGSYRVSVMGQGAAVGPPSEVPVDGRISGSVAALVPLATGGGSARLAGAKVRGRRRLRPLLQARRRAVQLSELARLIHQPEPAVVLEVALLAIDPVRVDRTMTIDVTVGRDRQRVRTEVGTRPTICVATDVPADATLQVQPDRLAAVLAGQDSAVVDGDATAVSTLLSWLDA